jgi:hypothetical protein
MEAGEQHHLPHFHAYYQNSASVFSIDPIEQIEGNLPRKQIRLVEAWAELHQNQLMECWHLLQQGRKPFNIEPLH